MLNNLRFSLPRKSRVVVSSRQRRRKPIRRSTVRGQWWKIVYTS
jgi:hypothetical protein